MALGKRLRVLVNGPSDNGPGLPTLDQVLYARPNPDGSRKACENCMFWARSNQCAIHSRDLTIGASAICGYHVFGQPTKVREDRGQDPIEPELSGLAQVPGGTSCDTCRWYEGRAAGGLCNAVSNGEGGRASVDAKGCCARWQSI